MGKILLKAAVLFLIVLSIYLIVNPTACSNFLAGRTRVLPAEGEVVEWRHPMAEQPGAFSPEGLSPDRNKDIFSDEKENQTAVAGQGVFDTNTLNEQQEQPVYSQEDIDYAIASRYVELEREYAGGSQDMGKDASREISLIVMDDFEMSPTEWEAFLSRATASGLFDRVRKEMPPTPPAQ